jgi:hypothetical protein
LLNTTQSEAPSKVRITSPKRKLSIFGNTAQQLPTAGFFRTRAPVVFATPKLSPIIFLACNHSPHRVRKQNDPTVSDRRVVEGERNGIEQEIQASQQTRLGQQAKKQAKAL